MYTDCATASTLCPPATQHASRPALLLQTHILYACRHCCPSGCCILWLATAAALPLPHLPQPKARPFRRPRVCCLSRGMPHLHPAALHHPFSPHKACSLEPTMVSMLPFHIGQHMAEQAAGLVGSAVATAHAISDYMQKHIVHYACNSDMPPYYRHQCDCVVKHRLHCQI